MARALGRADGFMICVEDATTPKLVGTVPLALHKAPGRGDFTIPEDKEWIANVLVRMIQRKLKYFLECKDLHNYRFLLNVQHHYLDGLSLQCIEGLLPAARAQIDPLTDPIGFATAKFLHGNAFTHVSQVDAAGWSPLCYAVVRGDVEVVQALLASRAHCQDVVKKASVDKFIAPKLPVLSLAAAYRSNDVMKLLLSYRANINARDGFRACALSPAGLSDNAAGVRILLEAQIDLNIHPLPGIHPFAAAAACNSLAYMQEIQAHAQLDLSNCGNSWSLKFCLPFALIAGWPDDKVISYLIEARADVNQQLSLTLKEPLWWLFFNGHRARHFVSPSLLTRLCYHHKSATPLMLSILAGRPEVVSVLLQAGARLDLKNSRGRTVADFLDDISVPECLASALVSCAQDCADSDSNDCFSV